MPIRFLADADLNEDIVTGLVRREPRIDFQTARAANLRSLSDPEVLAMAARENRILVTHDRRTMPRHFADFIQYQYSPGVFVIAQSVRVGIAIEALLCVWTVSDSEDWVNLIVSLPL